MKYQAFLHHFVSTGWVAVGVGGGGMGGVFIRDGGGGMGVGGVGSVFVRDGGGGMVCLVLTKLNFLMKFPVLEKLGHP